MEITCMHKCSIHEYSRSQLGKNPPPPPKSFTLTLRLLFSGEEEAGFPWHLPPEEGSLPPVHHHHLHVHKNWQQQATNINHNNYNLHVVNQKFTAFLSQHLSTNVVYILYMQRVHLNIIHTAQSMTIFCESSIFNHPIDLKIFLSCFDRTYESFEGVGQNIIKPANLRTINSLWNKILCLIKSLIFIIKPCFIKKNVGSI